MRSVLRVQGAVLVACLVTLAGCKPKQAPSSTPRLETDAAALPSPQTASVALDTSEIRPPAPSGDPAAEPFDGARFPLARIASAKTIGHTSVVFKLDFTGGGRAAFKPESKIGHGRWRGEVAAYRLGVALGIPYVPPAYAVTIDRGVLSRAARAKDSSDLVTSEVVARGSDVHGALIPWIDPFSTWPFESAAWRARWRPALRLETDIAKLTDEERAVLPAISTMIAFDYVTGNWDRWSGANIGRSGDRVLFIDNDGAFFDPAPKEALAKQRDLLEGVQRFSKGLHARLASVNDEWLASALGAAPDGSPLVSPSVRKAVQARVQDARSIIRAAIEKHGDAVLAFP